MTELPVLPQPHRLLRRPTVPFARRARLRPPVWAPPRPARGEIVFARPSHHVTPGSVVTVEGEVRLDPASGVPSTGTVWIPVFSGFTIVGADPGLVAMEVGADGRFRVEVLALGDAAGSCSSLVVTVGGATGRVDLTA